jgi:hypothetical protein
MLRDSSCAFRFGNKKDGGEKKEQVVPALREPYDFPGLKILLPGRIVREPGGWCLVLLFVGLGDKLPINLACVIIGLACIA